MSLSCLQKGGGGLLWNPVPVPPPQLFWRRGLSVFQQRGKHVRSNCGLTPSDVCWVTFLWWGQPRAAFTVSAPWWKNERHAAGLCFVVWAGWNWKISLLEKKIWGGIRWWCVWIVDLKKNVRRAFLVVVQSQMFLICFHKHQTTWHVTGCNWNIDDVLIIFLLCYFEFQVFKTLYWL